MDQRLFLRDIDDWELYARGLEAHVGAWEDELRVWLTEWAPDRSAVPMTAVHQDMARVLNEAADRMKRLREPDRLSEHHLYPNKT